MASVLQCLDLRILGLRLLSSCRTAKPEQRGANDGTVSPVVLSSLRTHLTNDWDHNK